MKIAVCSDLHLEFGDCYLKNTENAEVLILSGDICVANELPYKDSLKGQRYRDFFKRVSFQFPHVIWVAGNHEHYHGQMHKTLQICKEYAATFPNVYFLEADSKVINGVKFIGSTMWTNVNNGDTLTMYHLKACMNDFRVITVRDHAGNYFKFTPEWMFGIHVRTKRFFDIALANNKQDNLPVVMVTHHSPSKLSTHPYYKDDHIMNGGYSSDLSEFILDHPEIKLWTHGHTHYPFDYVLGDTRVVCNPCGYQEHEAMADSFQLKFVEI